MNVSVLHTPADFAALATRCLDDTACVVFDVLRATSSIVTALSHGAEAILPVREIADALNERRRDPSLLLAGERHGLRIGASLTGDVEFDFGNSPREFLPERVRGSRIAITTTNGTRALQSCRHARWVLASSFLNLGSTTRYLRTLDASEVVIICSGTGEKSAYEDVLGAGALCSRLMQEHPASLHDDSALMARTLFDRARGDLVGAFQRSENGRRLLTLPELAADIAVCANTDTLKSVALADAQGWLRSVALPNV